MYNLHHLRNNRDYSQSRLRHRYVEIPRNGFENVFKFFIFNRFLFSELNILYSLKPVRFLFIYVYQKRISTFYIFMI